HGVCRQFLSARPHAKSGATRRLEVKRFGLLSFAMAACLIACGRTSLDDYHQTPDASLMDVPGDIHLDGDTPPVCAPNETQCGANCVDLQSDPANCGACGRACGAGLVCSMGTCQATCTLPLTNCSGACVNLQTDTNHCGSCTNNCPTGAVCASGTCQM